MHFHTTDSVEASACSMDISCGSSKNTSKRPPVGFCSNKRARMTRVLFTHNCVPAGNTLGRSVNRRSVVTAPCRHMSSRALERGITGWTAMADSGSSYA